MVRTVPSASTLLYLFAGEALPRSEPQLDADRFDQPCAHARLNARALGSLMLGVTFSSLKDKALLTLQLAQPPLSGKPTLLVEAAGRGARPAFALEDLLLDCVHEGGGALEVVVGHCLPISIEPERTVLGYAEHELDSLGFVVKGAPARGILEDMVYGPASPEFNCDEIASLRGDFDQTWAAWLNFCSTEALTADLLVAGCSAALHNRAAEAAYLLG